MPLDADVVRDVVLIGVLVLAVVVLTLLRRSGGRPVTGEERAAVVEPAVDRPRQAAVVVHAVKIRGDDVRREDVAAAAAAIGWAAPSWRDTTELDTGRSQALAAVEDGADAVVAFGGDGTARVVGDALRRTGVPLGLLPAGTGNLLARNLGIPPNRLDEALRIALAGRDRMIDVGRAEIDLSGRDAEPVQETFLVMAGLGFDAEVMAGVDPLLKERVGWFAYVVAGLTRIGGSRTLVTLQVDDGPLQQRRVRAVVVGNCGTLTAGIPLMPQAAVDDGWLDVVVVSPRTVLGWLGITATVLTRAGHPAVEHVRCRSIDIRAERPLHVQLDGDSVGTARRLRASVDPLALLVRVP